MNNHRKPDVKFGASIYTDSKRRDLTCNALYYDISSREIIDLVGGLDDIRNGVVRTVGRPEDRFQEDHLRRLRVIRFAARLGHDVDRDIDASLRANNSLQGVSAERIRDEFLKGVASAQSVVQFVQMLSRYGLLMKILPNASLNGLVEERDPIVLMASLLAHGGVDAAVNTLRSGKYTNEEIKGVKFLIGLQRLSIQNAVVLKKMQAVSGVSSEQIQRFSDHMGLDKRLTKAFEEFRLTVTASDFPDIKAGPELGASIHHQETENFAALI